MQISKKNRQFALKNLLFKLTQQISQNPSTLPTLSESQISQICASSINSQYSAKDEQKMKSSLSIFYKHLIIIPEQWTLLLINDGIQSETETIMINSSSTITKLYDLVIKKTESDILLHSLQQKQPQSFQDCYMNETCLALITEIFNAYATIIVEYYMKQKQAISECVKKIDTKIKSSEVMNSYIVFSLLKQMAKYSQRSINENIHKRFPQYSQQNIQKFSKYIQKNYEFLSLSHINSGQNYIFDKKQKQDHQAQQNLKWLNIIENYQSNNLRMSKIQSMEGHTGYLIQRESFYEKKQKPIQGEVQGQGQKQRKQKLILKVEQGKQIQVINANVCQKSWRIFQTNQSIQELQKKLKEQIQYSEIKKQYVSYGVSTCQLATIGGSLGKCLANIDKYHNANEFLLDLSKSTAIYTTFSIALTQIPILSYFIIAGGFTYTFYMACSNQALSSFKKANIIGKATVSAVGSVGCSLGGILLGQAMIPVPFFGALVGGIFGGYFGAKGTNKFNQITDKKNFLKIISYIRLKSVNGRCWKYTKELLGEIGLSQKYFNQNTGNGENQKDAYITAICFCIITFHESKRYEEYNKQKLKEHEQKKKELQKQWHEYEIQIQKEEKPFVNQFNIVDIIDYLTEEHFNILDNLDHLANFISHLL